MYKNYSVASTYDPFELKLIAGITQIDKGNYLDSIHDKRMDGYMLQLTTFGSGYIFDGKKEFTVCRGQLLLFSPSSLQYYHRHPDAHYWHYKWIYFPYNLKWNKLLNWGNTEEKIGRIFIPDNFHFQEISQLFSKINNELKATHFLKDDVTTALLEYLLMKCILVEKREVIPTVDQRILIVCDFILSNISENYSIEYIAEKVFLSSSRLSHLFKQNLGISLIQWRELQRISEAKKLLYFSNISISNIAKSLGYEDSLYFSKIFKKHTGISPSEFRMTDRNNFSKM